MTFLALAGWVPDADASQPGVILDCQQLVPSLRGMKAAASAVNSSLPALAGAALGSALCIKLDGTARVFAGTTSALYEAASTSWTDRTRATGGSYTASSERRWRFAQFGDTTIAVQKADWPQFSTTGAFANIVTGGTKYAPKARLVETAQGFVVLADVDDTGAGLGTTFADGPNRWWCSAQLDYTDWTPAVATQCTTGLLVDSPGRITALKRLGGSLVAYKDTSMYLGSYVGAPVVWQWQLIPGEAGTATQEAVIDIGDAHLFIGRSDFYLFDGSRPVSIGDGIREWFFANLNSAYREKTVSLHDKANANAYWFFCSGGSSTPNACIVYNYRAKKWGRADISVETSVTYALGGETYAGMAYTYATLPAVTYDSSFWTGAGGLTMGVFNTSHVLQYLNGTPGTATLTTSDIGSDGDYSTLRRVRPRYLTAPSAATMTPSYRDLAGAAYTTNATITQDAGKFDYLQSARWHRLALSTTGSMELTGLDIEGVPSGRR